MTDQSFSTYADVWPLCGETSQAIFTLTRPVVNPMIEELGLRGLLNTLLTARSYEPEPISPDRMYRRTPYASLASWEKPLPTLAERDLLAANGDGSFQLTAGGRAIVTRLLKEFYAGLAKIEQAAGENFHVNDFQRLTVLLEKIVSACLNVPIDQWSLTTTHHLAPAAATPFLARIDQALDDLNAFRDDAHLAAWRPRHIDGHTWELFTFLWRGDVRNADEMAEKAAARGITREAYQSALGDLIGRGWVRATGESAYEVTGAGRQIREEAEVQTDRDFYTPWTVLNQDEVNDVYDLLTRLTTVLMRQAEAVPA